MSASAAPLPEPLASGAVHPVDEVLAAPRLIALGIQHVLVMYAGAVAVPLIIGAAIKAPREQVAFLITCDLLACGIASLLQSVGVWRFGIRLPVIMGVTFAAVGPMVAINLEEKPNNLLIIAISIAFGMIPIVSQQFFGQFPHFLGPLLHSGILLASISAVVLNAYFNGARGLATRGFDPVHAAHGVGGVESASHD